MAIVEIPRYFLGVSLQQKRPSDSISVASEDQRAGAGLYCLCVVLTILIVVSQSMSGSEPGVERLISVSNSTSVIAPPLPSILSTSCRPLLPVRSLATFTPLSTPAGYSSTQCNKI